LAVVLLCVVVLGLWARVDVLTEKVEHLETCVRNGWRF
jgi:hypothetical protein